MSGARKIASNKGNIVLWKEHTDVELSENESKLDIYCCVMKSICTCGRIGRRNSHDLCRDTIFICREKIYKLSVVHKNFK